jgi:hypothetical protein
VYSVLSGAPDVGSTLLVSTGGSMFLSVQGQARRSRRLWW